MRHLTQIFIYSWQARLKACKILAQAKTRRFLRVASLGKAHCGTSLLGNFIGSITLNDIYSGWTENAAVWNKGAAGVLSEIEWMEAHLPFSILGFDCDNASDF